MTHLGVDWVGWRYVPPYYVQLRTVYIMTLYVLHNIQQYVLCRDYTTLWITAPPPPPPSIKIQREEVPAGLPFLSIFRRCKNPYIPRRLNPPPPISLFLSSSFVLQNDREAGWARWIKRIYGTGGVRERERANRCREGVDGMGYGLEREREKCKRGDGAKNETRQEGGTWPIDELNNLYTPPPPLLPHSFSLSFRPVFKIVIIFICSWNACYTRLFFLFLFIA